MSARIELDRELKGLQSQLSSKRGDLAAAKASMTTAQRLVSTLERDINGLEARIAELGKSQSSDSIIVTEHAILRYLERVYEIDIEAVKSEIVADSHSAIAFMGSGELKRPAGFTLVIKNNSIVTIK